MCCITACNQNSTTGDGKRNTTEQYKLAIEYIDSLPRLGDSSKIDIGLRYLKKAANRGLKDAQGYLGYLYCNGKYIKQDYTKAVKWYAKAAEQGYAAAQHNLGALYCNGHGVEQDYAKAAEWFEKATEQGYAAAQYSLGILYHNGLGGGAGLYQSR